ncbi:MAG: AhpC/TSA family protein [Prevotella sp.]|jgi:peroxiredoxin|nr:AhpC/TSA family protein [Prevotella sp.]
MKKNIIFLTLLLIVIASCNKTPSDTFVLQGTIEGGELPDTVYLSYYYSQDNEWYEKEDTAKVVDGKFTFTGKLDGLTYAYLDFDNDYIQMFIEPSNMELHIDKEQSYMYKLSGTQVDKENQELQEEVISYSKFWLENSTIVSDLFKQLNSTENLRVRDSLMNIIRNHSEKLTLNAKGKHLKYIDFVSRHTRFQISPALLFSVARSELVSSDTILSVYNSLPEELKTSLMGKLAYRQIIYQQSKGMASAGDIAPDFTKTDLSGNNIKLSDFRDKKYVLLDFWASWCGPCVKEIPNLKEIYNKYNGRLQILSISADENKDDWLQAVEKYQLKEWPQILDLAHSDGRLFDIGISDVYKVEFLPTVFLIDKQGKIIARWANFGEEQRTMLDNLLK